MQVSKQLFGFNGCREVQSFADTPLAIELVDDQLGIPKDGDLSWRAGSKVFQDLDYSCVFRHIVGHGAALTDQTVLPHKDGPVSVFDHHSVGSGSSWV
jgi:hypothetical protein